MKKRFVTVATTILLSTLILSGQLALAETTSTTIEVKEEVPRGSLWTKTLEAESGLKFGNVSQKPISGNNITVTSNIGQGKNNYLSLLLKAPETKESTMSIRYISGENRNLSFEVNEAASKKDIHGLNSGGWSKVAVHEEKIVLNKGINAIKFYLEDGWAPDLDAITFSMENVEVEMNENLQVQFMSDGNLLSQSELKKGDSLIDSSIVPQVPTKEGKDFLGWFWGPIQNPTKYEGQFPLNTNDVPEDIMTSLDGEITFYARFGNHIEPNPIEKPGYRVIFNDEFQTNHLDTNNWVDRYLSSWSTSAAATNNWDFDGENAIIKIDKDTQPWAPEFDGQTVVSGFTTGQRNGLHNWNRTNVVRNPEDTRLTHINQYGYYEIRAKGQEGSSRHIAWWLIGFEDVPEESMEIDIFEVQGRNSNSTSPAIHKWNDPDSMPYEGLQNYRDVNKDFNNEWHVYGLDWIENGGSGAYPDRMDLYVDGIKTSSINVNIDYPLIQLFSLYEKRAGGWTGNWEWMPYPNTFDIDYVRVYKKLVNEQQALAQDKPSVTKVTAEDLQLNSEELTLKTYEGTSYTEKNLPGTKSYVRALWNDGIETQEPVVWEEITPSDLKKIASGKTVKKKGYVASINRKATMNIRLKNIETVDKSTLEESIHLHKNKLEPDYTPKSWKVFSKALNKAQEILLDEQVKQKKVDEALIALEKAATQLEKITTMAVSKVDLNVSGMQVLKTGESLQLVPTFSPSHATETTVTWKVEKDNIASIDEEGLLLAHASGVTKITVETTNGKKDSFVLRVIK